MKRLFTSFLGAVCLFALSACSDEETPAPQPGSGDTEELPALPSEVIKDGRAMWVSYDPTPDADANSTTFIHGALVSWRLLQSDPSNVAFDIYKSVDGGQEVKLNVDALFNSTCFLDENIEQNLERYKENFDIARISPKIDWIDFIISGEAEGVEALRKEEAPNIEELDLANIIDLIRPNTKSKVLQIKNRLSRK